jgi:outer membrane receptor protein involved in Fe transport
MRSLALALVGSLAVVSASRAQTIFANVTGLVTDPDGAVVVAAKVTATNDETGVTSVAFSNDKGLYTLSQLLQGRYRIVVRAPGFRDFTATDMVLLSRDIRRLDARLELAGVSETLEVVAGASVIETETARISDTRTFTQLNTLPLNSRGIYQFVFLTPQVVERAGGSSYSFAGTRGNQSQWAIDGTTMSDGVGETQIGPLANYIESFQEAKVDIASTTAEYPTFGQVTLISRSGTNRWHGSAFDYYTSPDLRARNPFDLSRPGGVSHSPGFSVSGPVWLGRLYDGRNRTFGYVSAETTTGSQSVAQLAPTVPLEPWRNGDFSSLGIPIRNPFTGEIYASGRIPPEWINPVAQRIQQRFYPLPNFGDASSLSPRNYREAIPVATPDPRYLVGRVDHNIGSSDRVFGRFTMHEVDNPGWEGSLPAFGTRTQFRQNKAVTVAYTRLFAATTAANEIRYGHAYNNNPVSGPLNGLEVTRDLGLEGLAAELPDISGVFRVSFPGTALTALGQIDWRRPGFLNDIHEVQDQLTWWRGAHTIKTGVDFRHIVWTNGRAPEALFGSASFTSRYTTVPGVPGSGHPYADFLFGVPTSVARADPPNVVERERWTLDLFVQDDWRLTPDLTLNLGFRYDYHPVWAETSGRQAVFDLASGAIAVADRGMSEVSRLMPRGYVPVVSASEVGLPVDALVRTDGNNFSPRIGVAHRPFGRADLVLRGGYGLAYDMTPIDLMAGGVPFVIAEPTYTNALPVPVVVLPRAFPAAGTGGPMTVQLPNAVNPDLQMPVTQQWTVTVEHQRGRMGFRLSYVGTIGRGMWYTRDINAPVPDERPYTAKPRAYPNFPAINYVDNGAGHAYHAFGMELERRMSNGFGFQVTYTLARDVGTDSGIPENPFDLPAELGRDENTPRHRATSFVHYDLPFGRGRRWLASTSGLVDALVGGWQLAIVGLQQTGVYLTPLVTMPDPTGTRFTTGARPIVTIRPDQIQDAALSDASIDKWYDPQAFAPPPLGRFGNAERGSVVGPGLNVWHAGVYKSFGTSSSSNAPRIRLEASATNVLNQPQWGNPNMNVTAGNAASASITTVGGPTTGQQAGPRRVRLGLRVDW